MKKRQWSWIKLGLGVSSLLMLSGCEQVSLVRQWWQAWRNPTAVTSPQAGKSQKVAINVRAIARRHPAWKLAQTLETSSQQSLTLNWNKPPAFTASILSLTSSTAAQNNLPMSHIDFVESAQTVTTANAETYQEEMSQKQQAAWQHWENNINATLEADRADTARAMRVDLRDAIEQTRKDIPELVAPLTPAEKLQTEMIHLRLKLLNNIALSPADKTATESRLEELETAWIQQLRQQAQQEAEKQQYWRETVPRQMRAEGEAKIEQTVQQLQQQDQQSIDALIEQQQQTLAQDTATFSLYAINQPAITNHTEDKSTFHAPVLSSAVTKPAAIPLAVQQFTVPHLPSGRTSTQMPSKEVQQLKQIALNAAQRAAAQSAARHGWIWIKSDKDEKSALPDVTNIVLRETSFP